jgi:hypothetical protein
MGNNSKPGRGMALGIAIGAAIGVATDNIGLWLAIGVALGAGMESRFNRQKEE